VIFLTALTCNNGLTDHVDEILNQVYDKAPSKQKPIDFLLFLNKYIIKKKDKELAKSFLLTPKIYDFLKSKYPDWKPELPYKFKSPIPSNPYYLKSEYDLGKRIFLDCILNHKIKEFLPLRNALYLKGIKNYSKLSLKEKLIEAAKKYDPFFAEFPQKKFSRKFAKVSYSAYTNQDKSKAILLFSLTAPGATGKYGFIVFKAITINNVKYWIPFKMHYGIISIT
jgi:hypothetical protein